MVYDVTMSNISNEMKSGPAQRIEDRQVAKREKEEWFIKSNLKVVERLELKFEIFELFLKFI